MNSHCRLFTLLLTTALAGCCGYRPDLPPTARVSGTVTLDGNPLPNARVQFVPDSSKATEGALAYGTTDAEGKYELETATVRGAIVGHHRISVEARAQPKDEFDTLPELLTPAFYGDVETSKLTAEVADGERNTVDLKLVSLPP